jgi:hypothetical protein
MQFTLGTSGASRECLPILRSAYHRAWRAKRGAFRLATDD